MDDVFMGKLPKNWMGDKKIQYITFSVTDECNLACRYCYFTHKNSHNKMSFKTAVTAIDYILEEPRFNICDGVVWDFIGGEPTLELKLIDSICEYILKQMFLKNHKWLKCYRFMIGTNGILYNSPKMQELIKKYGINLQVSITIDGNKEKHDLSRIKKDGIGSYDDIVKNIALWQSQQGDIATKATFSHDDLPYLKDSIIHLWNLGIRNVMANLVFENVWLEGDSIIFKQQLHALADYIIESDCWNKYSVRFFDPSIGMPLSEKQKENNFCGSGKMLAINTEGNYYPCVRFMDSALNNKKGRIIGSIHSGMDLNRIRAFELLDNNSLSDKECLTCEYASGCAWCSGLNYDLSEFDTIYDRKKYICKMHKVNVEECRYLWNEYEKIKNTISPYTKNFLLNNSESAKSLYILTRDSFPSYCEYKVRYFQDIKMSESEIKAAYYFCREYFYKPIIIGDAPPDILKFCYHITDDINTECLAFSTCLLVHSNNVENVENNNIRNVILKIEKNNIQNMSKYIDCLIENNNKISNINICFDDDEFEDGCLESYEKELYNVIKILEKNLMKNRYVDISNISHLLRYDNHHNCRAGFTDALLAPDGNFYICPAFYYDNKYKEKYKLVNIHSGLNQKYAAFTNIDKCKICKNCYNFQCKKCIYNSLRYTDELSVPTFSTCEKSDIEYKISKEYYGRASRITKSDIYKMPKNN